MIIGQVFKHGDGETYTVKSIGPMGSGKFFGKQIVYLERADGINCYAQTKNGRLPPDRYRMLVDTDNLILFA